MCTLENDAIRYNLICWPSYVLLIFNLTRFSHFYALLINMFYSTVTQKIKTPFMVEKLDLGMI